MLDTIKFEIYAPLKVPCQCQIPLPSGKFFRLWVDPTKRYLTRVECSLPKLVFGHNGRLIGDQGELDRAMKQLREAVAKVADVPDSGVWVPSRCDLVWQLGGMEAGKVIDVLAGFRFPGIQKPPMHMPEQSVTWKGAHSRFMVSAYDKAKQLRVEGDVLRIEVRLCGKVFRKRLGHRDWRNFADLYAVYREVILSLPTLPKASTEHSMLTALTMCSGPEAAEAVLMMICRNKETIRKYRREIRIAHAKLPSTLVWSDIFSAATPPPPVTIEPAMPTDILTQPAAPRVRISSNQSTRVAETTHTATGPPQIEKSQRSKIVNPKTASVSEKIADKRAERLERCPTSARSLLARCWSKKASPRQAIKAFCHECCGYDRAAIAGCNAWACPIFEYRPYQKPSAMR